MKINDIATKADIEDVLFAIDQLRLVITSEKDAKKILRSADVRKILNISDSTLQRLRISNSLPGSKVNGTWFYKYEDVLKMTEGDLR